MGGSEVQRGHDGEEARLVEVGGGGEVVAACAN